MLGRNNPFDLIGSILSGIDPMKEEKRTMETTIKVIEAIVESPEAETKKMTKKILEAIKEDTTIERAKRDIEQTHNLFKAISGQKVIEKVMPVPGCICYCDLGPAEHTGVYIGSNHIAGLNGDCNIKSVSADDFLDSSTVRTGTKIYIACDKDGNVLYNSEIARRATRMVGRTRDYGLIMYNCHQFTCGCILDDFENANNLFWMVEHTIEDE